jgi:hypothetical protein
MSAPVRMFSVRASACVAGYHSRWAWWVDGGGVDEAVKWSSRLPISNISACRHPAANDKTSACPTVCRRVQSISMPRSKMSASSESRRHEKTSLAGGQWLGIALQMFSLVHSDSSLSVRSRKGQEQRRLFRIWPPRRSQRRTCSRRSARSSLTPRPRSRTASTRARTRSARSSSSCTRA